MNARRTASLHATWTVLCFAIAAIAGRFDFANSAEVTGTSTSAPPPGSASSASEIDLGKKLFEDRNLSADRTTACASCHIAANGFADPRALSTGVHKQIGTRHAPSLQHLDRYRCYFWDCRVQSLEEQAFSPFFSRAELGLDNKEQLIDRVRTDPRYVAAFDQVYGLRASELEVSQIVRAIVAYERSLGDETIPLDAYLNGEAAALDLQSRRGLEVFRSRAGCATCHLVTENAAPLTDGLMHPSALGLGILAGRLPALARELDSLSLTQRLQRIASDPDVAALGRFVLTLDPHDLAQFRTPTLRDAARGGPYMHDGSITNLAEAVDLELYYRGVEIGYPIILSPKERADLLAFLQGLAAPRTPSLVHQAAGAEAQHSEALNLNSNNTVTGLR